MGDEDYGDGDDFEGDTEDYADAYEAKASSPAPAQDLADADQPAPSAPAAAAAAAAVEVADREPPRPAAAKAPAGDLPVRPVIHGAAASRVRSRVKLSSKGQMPVLSRPMSLPQINPHGSVFGGASSGDAASASNEYLVSEQLSVAVSAEMQAQEHLRRVRAKVQRELRKAASQGALQGVREQKLEQSRAMRADMDRKVGRDLIRQITNSDIPPATEEEVMQMSVLFNKHLENFHPEARNFFSLFKHIDVDGSRRVSFSELQLLIRDQLKVTKSQLPPPRLHALWRALDENASGFVDPGELGRFMKLGMPKGGLGAKERTRLEKQRTKQLMKQEQDRKSGKELTRFIQINDVPAASEEQVRQFSELFNKQMLLLRPREGTNGQNFYRLFKHMDIDNSGRISFGELRKMVREELRVGPEAMSKTELQGLWRALDDNESGFICAGEFGRFMNMRGVSHEVPNEIAGIREKQRADHVAEITKSAVDWKAQAAERASREAQRLANEAAELEAMLEAAKRGSSGGALLPQIGHGRGVSGNAALDQLKGRLNATSARPRVLLDKTSRGLQGSLPRGTPPAVSNPNPPGL